MSSFLNNKLGQTISHAAALSQSISHATAANIELRVGSHTVQVKERLAEGGFGVVDLVVDIHSKRELVLKRCNIDRNEAFETVRKEINLLQRFEGPYIAKLLGSEIIQKNRDSREALLLMEYYPGGHLLDRLNKRHGNYLPAEGIYRIFGQICLAIKPLHESNPPIVQRDLKLENVLFGTDGKVRLCDFGSCIEGYVYLRNSRERESAEEVINKETTPAYRAPEMVNLYMREVLTEKTDIWALGCIFYTLCFLVHPFQDAGNLGVLNAKVNIPANSPITEEGHAMLMRMLDVDPEARLSVSEILACIVALAHGNPLPDFPLSEEAKRRREERLAANTVRTAKNAKKVVAAPPQRKVAPISSNSVAAKRLAAKRGEEIPSSSPSLDAFGSSSTAEASFADFGVASDPQPAAAATSAAAASFDANFDAFGDNGGGDDFFSNAPKHSAAVRPPSFSSSAVATEDFFGETSSLSVGASSGGVRPPSFDAADDFSAPPAKPVKPPSFSDSSFTATRSSFASEQKTTTAFDAFGAEPTQRLSFSAFGAAENSGNGSNRTSFNASSTQPTSSSFVAFDDSFETAPATASAAPKQKSAASSLFGAIDDEMVHENNDLLSDDFAASSSGPAASSSFYDAQQRSVPVSAPVNKVPSNSSASADLDIFGTSGAVLAAQSAAKRPSAQFIDDLLTPAPASTSRPTSQKLNVLDLFDQPKPEPAPKSVMLNNSKVIPPMGGPMSGAMYGVAPGMGGAPMMMGGGGMFPLQGGAFNNPAFGGGPVNINNPALGGMQQGGVMGGGRGMSMQMQGGFGNPSPVNRMGASSAVPSGYSSLSNTPQKGAGYSSSLGSASSRPGTAGSSKSSDPFDSLFK